MISEKMIEEAAIIYAPKGTFYSFEIHEETLQGGKREAFKDGARFAIAELEPRLKIAEKALEKIEASGAELQPNSGWMYLSDINYMWGIAGKALAKIKEKRHDDRS